MNVNISKERRQEISSVSSNSGFARDILALIEAIEGPAAPAQTSTPTPPTEESPPLMDDMVLVCRDVLGWEMNCVNRRYLCPTNEGRWYSFEEIHTELDANLAHQVKQAILGSEASKLRMAFTDIMSDDCRLVSKGGAILYETPELIIRAAAAALRDDIGCCLSHQNLRESRLIKTIEGMMLPDEQEPTAPATKMGEATMQELIAEYEKAWDSTHGYPECRNAGITAVAARVRAERGVTTTKGP